ncbi:hypothetical protein Vadar_009547 [Vaccinium darrowii]|uniref:Uncharacterized protein n=1 Tax=Vaccinium darrowii TaxID=229202 RepID=A0ACB7X8V4_9ERIC|nr:hypothetical protein Vadar_009547 [Vaccinium darrowii]
MQFPNLHSLLLLSRTETASTANLKSLFLHQIERFDDEQDEKDEEEDGGSTSWVSIVGTRMLDYNVPGGEFVNDVGGILAFADPLFVDQYAGCFVPDNIPMDMGHYPHHYCLATKFVDDKLLTTLNNRDGLRQQPPSGFTAINIGSNNHLTNETTGLTGNQKDRVTKTKPPITRLDQQTGELRTKLHPHPLFQLE